MSQWALPVTLVHGDLDSLTKTCHPSPKQSRPLSHRRIECDTTSSCRIFLFLCHLILFGPGDGLDVRSSLWRRGQTSEYLILHFRSAHLRPIVDYLHFPRLSISFPPDQFASLLHLATRFAFSSLSFLFPSPLQRPFPRTDSVTWRKKGSETEYQALVIAARLCARRLAPPTMPAMDQRELDSYVKQLNKCIVANEAPENALRLLETLKKDAAPTEEMLRVRFRSCTCAPTFCE